MTGDLAKASIVHLAPGDSLTTIVLQRRSQGSYATSPPNPHYKITFCQVCLVEARQISLLQQCPSSLVHLTWFLRWQESGRTDVISCCFLDLFKIAR